MGHRWPGEPKAEHFPVTCHGCGAGWWNDEECRCTCELGAPNYEDWEVM